jgi:ZIP family zinc transporter
VIVIISFAGGTSFLGALISKKRKFSEQKILALTAFGDGILMSAAIFGKVVEAEKNIGLSQTMIPFVGGAVVFIIADLIADLIAEKKGGGSDILLNWAKFHF